MVTEDIPAPAKEMVTGDFLCFRGNYPSLSPAHFLVSLLSSFQGEPGLVLTLGRRWQEIKKQKRRPSQTCHKHYAFLALPASHGEKKEAFYSVALQTKERLGEFKMHFIWIISGSEFH